MNKSASHTSIELGQATRARMLEFIADYMAVNEWSPSYVEIAQGVGLASKSNVMKHLQQLEQEGKIVLGNGPRMIRVVK